MIGLSITDFMPIYEYICKQCDQRFEAIVSGAAAKTNNSATAADNARARTDWLSRLLFICENLTTSSDKL